MNMTSLLVQLNMLCMTGHRKPSTPSSYRKEFTQRVRSARIMSGKSQKQIAQELGVLLNTYQTWESRALIPHQCLIPFCQSTGVDPYFLLTGTPFSLGRVPAIQPRAIA